METKTDLFNVHVWKVFRAIMQRQSELWKRALFIQWSQCRDISLFVCAATQPMEEGDWTLTQKTSNYHFLYRKQKLVFRNLLCFWVSYFFVIFFRMSCSCIVFATKGCLRDLYGKINVYSVTAAQFTWLLILIHSSFSIDGRA